MSLNIGTQKHNMRSLIITLSCLALLSFSFTADWELKKDKEGIQVFTRKVPNSPMRAFRGEMLLETNLEAIEELFKDVDRFPEWSPGAKYVESLEQSANMRLFYLQTDAPWPVTDRDGIYQFTFSRTENELLIEAQCFPDRLPVRKDHVRVPKSEGYWRFTRLPEDRIKVVYENHSEPGGSIPGWLANSTVVNLPFQSLTNLRQMLR